MIWPRYTENTERMAREIADFVDADCLHTGIGDRMAIAWLWCRLCAVTMCKVYDSPWQVAVVYTT